MEHTQEELGKLLVEAYEKSDIDCAYDSEIPTKGGTIATNAPELITAWEEERSNGATLGEFILKCVKGANNPRLGRIWGKGYDYYVLATYYYSASDGKPPSKHLLSCVATCAKVTLGKTRNVYSIYDLSNVEGIAQIITELLDFYSENPNDLAKELVKSRPGELEWLLAPRERRLNVSDTDFKKLTEALIPEYPTKNRVNLDSPEMAEEIERVGQEVNLDSISRHIDRLQELTGYAGKNQEKWKAVFAYDWHYSLSIDANNSIWRSSSVYDVVGRHVFALLEKGDDEALWSIERFCSIDDLPMIDARESRSPRPNFHIYDYLLFKLSCIKNTQDKLIENGDVNSIATHVAAGRDIQDGVLTQLKAYINLWDDVRDIIYGNNLINELSFTEREVTVDELIEQVTVVMGKADYPSEWIALLNGVVSGCINCFKAIIPWHYPPILDQDLKDISEASAHFDKMSDSLVEITEFYVDMVNTLTESENYDSCGNSLNKIEKRLGGSLSAFFDPLCAQFVNAKLPVDRLYKIMQKATKAHEFSVSVPLQSVLPTLAAPLEIDKGLLLERESDIAENEIEAKETHASVEHDSVYQIAEVRRGEFLIDSDDFAWSPPSLEESLSSPVIQIAKNNAPDSRDGLVVGYEKDYERARKQGRALSIADLTRFNSTYVDNGVLSQVVSISEYIYIPEYRTLSAFLALVRRLFEDEIRPGHLYRLFLAFDEPDAASCHQSAYVDYCFYRTLAERFGIAEGHSSIDYVEYYATLTIGACESEMTLDDEQVLALCEALLFLLTRSPTETCLALCARFFSILGTMGEQLLKTINGMRDIVADTYIDPSTLSYEIRRQRSDARLASFKVYGESLGPDSYNDKFSGATYLWKWLIGQDCDPRFQRVRSIIDSLSGRTTDYNSTWCFLDDRDITDFIDGSFAAEESYFGRPNTRLEGTSRQKLTRFLREISNQYEKYCELRSFIASPPYVAPETRTACQCFLELHNDLRRYLANTDGWLATATTKLLNTYPDDSIPWGRDAAFDVDEELPGLTRYERSLIEFQAHRLDELPLWSIPTEKDLIATVTLGLSAYKNNVISSHDRETLRHVVASVLGLFEGVSPATAPSSLAHYMAIWDIEYLTRSLEHAMASAYEKLRETIVEQCSDKTQPDDARKQWLHEMLERLGCSELPEDVLSYGDFLAETNVALPRRPEGQPDEVLYGSKSVAGVYERIRDDLVEQRSKAEFYPSTRILGLKSDIRISEIGTIRDRLMRIEHIVNNKPVPVDGNSRNAANANILQKKDGFCSLLAELFEALGFTWAEVKPVENGDGTITRFTLDFLSIPGAMLSDGTLVCPLSQLLSLRPSNEISNGQNTRLYLEIYTNVEALHVGVCRRDAISQGRRIALYIGREASKAGESRLLTLRDRTTIASEVSSREEGTGFLLVDWLLIAYVLHWDRANNERISALLRCSTQFTHLHPYVDKGLPQDERSTPSKNTAPSDQPPLFYGRSQAIARISSFSAGSAYLVYGARRMGKTSILRQVEAIETAKRVFIDSVSSNSAKRKLSSSAFNISNHERTIAVYCDLRGHSGDSVHFFWVQHLAKELKKVVPGEIDGLDDAVTAEGVQDALSKYMMKRSTRILALLDEADEMVQYDSLNGDQRGGRTPILSSLYNYVTATHGSFKFVLSGLHATMRYSLTVPNKESGHMGDPQIIAPLWEDGGYQEAYLLVYEPMKAMGYKLEHESILSIIRRAGYYPNLINQICEQLLETVRARRDIWNLDSGPIVSVPDQLVSSVFADYDEILQYNFKDTIALDPVYGTIIYAIAELGCTRGWAPVSIKDISPVITVAFKEAGISKRIEGLDTYMRELEKFRVLRADNRAYTIRDQEIRFILDSIGAEEAHSQLLIAADAFAKAETGAYHPEYSRSQVGWINDNLFQLSPLNRAQIGQIDRVLLDKRCCIVCGSNEVGLDTLIDLVTHDAAQLTPALEGWKTVPVEEYEAIQSQRSQYVGRDILYIVEGGWNSTHVVSAQDTARADERFLFVAGPTECWANRKYINTQGSQLTVFLTPWETKNISQWLKRGVRGISDSLIDEVVRLTGGNQYLMYHLADYLLYGSGTVNTNAFISSHKGDRLLTGDLRTFFMSHTEHRRVAVSFAELANPDGNDFESINIWHEMLDGENGLSAFLEIVRWFARMGFVVCQDGLSPEELHEKAIISMATWAFGAFNGESVRMGGAHNA